MSNHALRSERINKIAQTLHEIQDRAEQNPQLQGEVNEMLAMIENVIGPTLFMPELPMSVRRRIEFERNNSV